MNKITLLALVFLSALFLHLPSSFADVSLISPTDNQTITINSQNINVNFDFSNTINETFCNLTIGGSLNSTITNVSAPYSYNLGVGNYVWSIACANETSNTQTLRINQPALLINASANPANGFAPLTVFFTAYGQGGVGPFSYLWNFGDGGFTTNANFTYIYTANNSYNAVVRVTDSLNQVAEKTFLINVTKKNNFTSNVRLDKSEYLIGENAHISIDAPLNSTVQLRFFKAETGTQIDSIDFTHSILNSDYIYLLYPPYPVSAVGNYTLRAYITKEGVTNNQTLSFALKTIQTVLPLTASIVVDRTTVEANRETILKSSVSGGIPPYNYEWDLNNDGVIDSTSVDSSKIFSIGNYTVKLRVRDSNNSVKDTSISINSIEPQYDAIFTVVDSYYNKTVENASVTFGGITKTTEYDGNAEYTFTRGNYTLKISGDNYNSYEQRMELKNDLSFTVRLDPISIRDLIITPLSPKNETTSKSEISYRVSGKNPQCTLFLKEGSWWASKSRIDGVGDKTFSLDLSDGNYEYKIECIDGTITKESDSYSFLLKKSAQTSAKDLSSQQNLDLKSSDLEVQTIVDWISEAKSTFENLDSKEKDAANSMGIASMLDEKKKAIEQIDRDIADLGYLTGSPSQIEERKREIYAKLRDIKGQIPKSISVTDETEFVKYARAEDVKALLLEMKKDAANYNIDEIIKLQNKVSIMTKVKKAEMTFYYADKKTYIIVDKKLEKKEDISNLSFIEVIPKSLSLSTKGMIFSVPYELIKDDPIVDLDTSQSNDLSYYFESTANINESENIRSILMPKSNSPKPKNSLTGFAISKLPIHISDQKLLIEVILIVILIGAYAYYNYSDEINGLFNRHDRKKMEYLSKLIGDAMDAAEKENMDEAYLIYTEIKLLYKSLSPKDKAIAFEDIKKIAYEINTKYALQLINKAIDYVRAAKTDEARRIYDEVQEIYSGLPEKYKAIMHEKSMNLYGILNA